MVEWAGGVGYGRVLGQGMGVEYGLNQRKRMDVVCRGPRVSAVKHAPVLSPKQYVCNID